MSCITNKKENTHGKVTANSQHTKLFSDSIINKVTTETLLQAANSEF